MPASTTGRAPFASMEDELRRIDFSGTIWFGSGLVAAAIPLAALLDSGWRPTDLPQAAAVAWWSGTILVAVGLFGFAYAGCPVLGKPLEVEDRLKSIAMQFGVLLYGIGAVTALLAVLLAPVQPR